MTRDAKKILLVEDDSSMRKLVEVILKKAGYEVISAQDAIEAMQILTKEKIDCLVADAIMPNLSGFDLCRIVRANNLKIPCIILSGLEKAQNDMDQSLFDAFILKNEGMKTSLISKLEDLLDNTSSREQLKS
ncbi:MAG: response regulator [Acidobacteria bacterium]|nr:MAG: response regulator [Acidobacteriota bacterium]